MGREYWLSRDPRLRQESYRGDARVPPTLRLSVRRFHLHTNAVVAGIDVGEDFLDIATLAHQNPRLKLTRIDLRDISSESAERISRSPLGANAVMLLGAILAEKVPTLRGAVVLVDSPRWPRDLDWSKRGVIPAAHSPHSREIDVGLRALVRTLRVRGANSTLRPLSMYPTPPMRYFAAHLSTDTCKLHLRMLGQALFGVSVNRARGPASGGIFTRFMIAGFATYRALETIGAEVYECYPDLQFRLWCRGHRLFSKTKSRRAALESRIRVLSSLACGVGLKGFDQVRRLDEADAAILALSIIAARDHGGSFIFENSNEGSFIVALDEPEALRFQRYYPFHCAPAKCSKRVERLLETSQAQKPCVMRLIGETR
jgi:hypothetical protein